MERHFRSKYQPSIYIHTYFVAYGINGGGLKRRKLVYGEVDATIFKKSQVGYLDSSATCMSNSHFMPQVERNISYELEALRPGEEIDRYRGDVLRSMTRSGNLSYTELKPAQPRPSIDPIVAPLCCFVGAEQ